MTQDKTSKRSAEKSDESVVSKKRSNKDVGAPTSAESVEKRDSAKGNPKGQNGSRTWSRSTPRSALDRIRQVAKRDKEAKFTTLWHHVYSEERLRACYRELSPKAAAGVDEVTWQEYGRDLERNLADLGDRLQRGAYRAKPVRRVHIPKSDGGKRALGIPALEDKIVQRATAEVLNAIYEEDFLGFSYGFRPGRSQHDALDAVTVGIERKKVNWVLDADIRGFFDTINHEHLVRFLEHRIADRRVVRHVRKWLSAGVMEKGKRSRMVRGTPQGGSISPLLANIYLHYVLDLWVQQWRRRHARGDVIIVRYADDFIVGFQHRNEAERFREDLRARLAKFDLELHPDKTRLIRFGRFAALNRKQRGEGKPETFNFLGFTHYCGKTRKGKFWLKRKTMKKRVQRKVRELKQKLKRRMHDPIPLVGRWLKAVLQGHYNYFGVPGNYGALKQLRWQIGRLWRQILSRRSQRSKMTWKRFEKIQERWLPRPKIPHPYPSERLRV